MLDISIVGLDAVISGFDGMLQRSGNLRPLLLEIGVDLTESTKQRFVTTLDPDGNKWLLNTPATLLAEDKFGNLRKEGDTPLTNHGDLAASIHYFMIGNDTVEVGSNMVQAAMMQFGSTKAEFPKLWGDIPARPYIGFSDDDRQHILELVGDYLL